jgi:hypothetical protein
LREERGSIAHDCLHNQRAVEKVITLLTTGLGNQQATMACRPMQRSGGKLVVGPVFGAYWVVRAKFSRFNRSAQMSVDILCGLDEAT